MQEALIFRLPNHTSVFHCLASDLVEVGRCDEAIEFRERLKELNPNDLPNLEILNSLQWDQKGIGTFNLPSNYRDVTLNHIEDLRCSIPRTIAYIMSAREDNDLETAILFQEVLFKKVNLKDGPNSISGEKVYLFLVYDYLRVSRYEEALGLYQVLLSKGIMLNSKNLENMNRCVLALNNNLKTGNDRKNVSLEPVVKEKMKGSKVGSLRREKYVSVEVKEEINEFEEIYHNFSDIDNPGGSASEFEYGSVDSFLISLLKVMKNDWVVYQQSNFRIVLDIDVPTLTWLLGSEFKEELQSKMKKNEWNIFRSNFVKEKIVNIQLIKDLISREEEYEKK